MVTVVMQTYYNLSILSLLVFGTQIWMMSSLTLKQKMKVSITKPEQSYCSTEAFQVLLEIIFVHFPRSVLEVRYKITS